MPMDPTPRARHKHHMENERDMNDKTNHWDPAILLADLLRCPSVTPEEAGALDVVEAFLTPLGFTCTRLKFEGDGSYPVDNLFATRGTGGKHLLFGGHTDVVPTGNEADWTHPPFSAEIVDGEIWGRGAVDMKSGVAAFCAAAARAVADGSADKGTISLAITNDEEADAVNGTEKILEWASAQHQRFDFAIVGEPSSAEKVGDRLKTGRRGSFDGLVIVRGQQGHAAYPEKARNPMPVLARVVTALTDKPLDQGNDHFQPSNLEVTSLDTGNKATNVIPAEGRLRFNVRFNDQWSAIALEDWVRARLASVDAAGCQIHFEPTGVASRSFVCPPGEGVALLDQVIAESTGLTPEHSTSGGTSDARFIALYCPVVECGLVGTHMHATDERVPLEQVEALTGIYNRFITRFLDA